MRRKSTEASGTVQAFFSEKKANKKHVPIGVGALVFDEVKVISRLMWNSRSQQMIGIAMHAEDMASLLDVYSTYDDTEHKTDQTNYIMQFLWRDLSSSYDIVGPYILHFKWIVQEQEYCSMCHGNNKALSSVQLQNDRPCMRRS